MGVPLRSASQPAGEQQMYAVQRGRAAPASGEMPSRYRAQLGTGLDERMLDRRRHVVDLRHVTAAARRQRRSEARYGDVDRQRRFQLRPFTRLQHCRAFPRLHPPCLGVFAISDGVATVRKSFR